MFVFVILAKILMACNNQPNTGFSTNNSNKKIVNKSDTYNIEQKINALKKLTPLTSYQLKTLLPLQIGLFKINNFQTNNIMGFSSAEALYQNKNATQTIKIIIFDCAGNAGAELYSLHYLSKLNIQLATEEGYTRTIDFMEKKAIETHQKNNNKYELTFLANNRLLIHLQSTSVTATQLKKIGESLHFSLST
ncbi:MAG: hypothetical protein KGK14_10930 [Bacteroidota bacterium]|nr:hypothetical protein [Bacteroidota bacterium]